MTGSTSKFGFRVFPPTLVNSLTLIPILSLPHLPLPSIFLRHRPSRPCSVLVIHRNLPTSPTSATSFRTYRRHSISLDAIATYRRHYPLIPNLLRLLPSPYHPTFILSFVYLPSTIPPQRFYHLMCRHCAFTSAPRPFPRPCLLHTGAYRVLLLLPA